MKKVIILLLLFISKVQSQQVIVSSTLPDPPWTGYLYSLNLSTCEVSNLVTTLRFFDIAQTPNGNLYGFTGLWYLINPETGSYTSLPISPGFPNALVALDNNTLLFVEDTDLIGYHISDGSLINFGNIGHTSAGDLTWYDNALYLTERSIGDVNILIKIVLNSGNTAIESVTQVNDNSNPLPGPVFGLTTASIGNGINMLIGSYDNKLYKICPFDASYELICETDYGQITGLTTLRLPIQNPQPINCNSLSLLDLENSTFSLFPNPVAKDGILYIKVPIGNTNFNTRIINMQGIVLYNEILQAHSSEIDLKKLNLSSGVYFVELSQGHKITIHKLVID